VPTWLGEDFTFFTVLLGRSGGSKSVHGSLGDAAPEDGEESE